MKLNYKALLLLIFLPLITFSQEKKKTDNELWYAQPATEWMQALPVGNGRLGAMVFGDPNHERIQLNEDSMWAGAPHWDDAKGSPEDLAQIRKLLKQGKNHLVDSLIVEQFSYKGTVRSHQTLGDLYIDFDREKQVENYTRSLSLDDALASVNYTSNGYAYSQKVFASKPDDVLVIELNTESPKGMDFTLRLDRPDDTGRKTVKLSNPSNTEISMQGTVTQFGGKKFSKPFPIDHGVKFETRIKVKHEAGTMTAKDGKLILNDVKKATIYLVGSTSFYHDKNYVTENNKTLSKIVNTSFQELLERHKKDYQKLYKRVDFSLGGKAMDSLPIDARLERFRSGKEDPDLAAKLFQYGRYLLISSSRPGTNPANLQGIWNEHIEAPWNADYHLNINLQMNYWPADVTNLSELNQPFFGLMDRVFERGRITAKKQYGIDRGTMAHQTTDLWATAFMRAEQAYWGSWIHGGGWAGQHYWEHYRFTKDEEFLKNRAYPTLKALSQFYLDWLVWDEKSKSWVSTPETSPENSYFAEDGKPAAVSFGSAMGHQIIAEVFDNTLEAARILNIKDNFTQEVLKKRKDLHPGVAVGDDGRILEWNEPYEEPEKGHRHMSHLYALHPGDAITAADPEVFEAAQKTIDFRLEHGGAGTGWSRAWMINFNARLLDSVAATKNIRKFLEISIADNLFDEHPPFQIDGNFGFTAGVAELLLQSHEAFLRLLPALPSTWKDGKITGLKARGNVEVAMEWKDGELVKLGLQSPETKSIKLKYQNKKIEVELPAGKKVWFDGGLKEVK
ncbi:alpha-L-fucosidase 2 [Salegentibacter echinorum]|uniref:Alpha-L-fucosidase 2 n=1 Tax=Salegentibacter echinorum TaxID=1073325 RepID=A0A1M5GFN6_SALEC|nr:glycoside hydrolase family 95 protein [Salegentibacter echinorum]SHG02534.1 alpha-L-fucosidase 2 [Salegentibacter echinorum]